MIRGVYTDTLINTSQGLVRLDSSLCYSIVIKTQITIDYVLRKIT